MTDSSDDLHKEGLGQAESHRLATLGLGGPLQAGLDTLRAQCRRGFEIHGAPTEA